MMKMQRKKGRRRLLLAIVLTLAMVVTMLPMLPETGTPLVATAATARAETDNPLDAAKAAPEYNPLLRMWYENPANISSNGPNSNNNANSWVRETLPIGNGYTGTLVFGGIGEERLHFNDKTLWSGGPSPNNPEEDYAFIGARTTAAAVTNDFLESFRQKLDDKSTNVFGLGRGAASNQSNDLYYLNQMFAGLQGNGGSGTGFAYYQDFGDIRFDFSPGGIEPDDVTGYVRDLDMNTAVASVDYRYGGVDYHREYFSSYPDNVQVGRLTASASGKLTFNARLTTWHMGTGTGFMAAGDTITMRGVTANSTSGSTNPTVTTTGTNRLRFEAQLKLIPHGGTLTANSDGTISIAGADTVDFIFSCGTDYKNEFPKYRGEDPHGAITRRIDAAAEKGYVNLLKDHLKDYQSLFDRVRIDLGEPYQAIPTDQRIQAYRAGETSKSVEVMAFQFGRYLMIAGSRDGALPINLQGAWGIGTFAWYGDYHFNINLQMNYWPTMSGNLAECMPSLIDYVDSLRKPGSIVAKRNNAAEGFIVNCFSNIYGYSAGNNNNQSAGNNPAGAAWILQNIYDYYRYTGDKEYLRTKIYPIMKDVADFWESYLWWSPYQQRLTVAPSVSPENGPTVVGATYDQSLVWQFLEEIIDAAQTLGTDADKIPVWRDMQSKLDPIQIGTDGQIKEWFEETSFGKAQAGDLPEVDIPAWRSGLAVDESAHRHASHLVGLYPGTLINKDNQSYMDAAKVSLTERTMEGTGWSKAHKISLWARTLDGDKSYGLVQSMLRGGNAGILENLLDSHGGGSGPGGSYTLYPIFQIDGNFGLTAGMIEMLLQSQLGYTQFLPAIPAAWSKGSVKGLVARGNFTVDMDWQDGKAEIFKVTSGSGGVFTGEYRDLSKAVVKSEDGSIVSVTRQTGDRISFQTEAGKTYTILFKSADFNGLVKALYMAESYALEDYSKATADGLRAAIKGGKALLTAPQGSIEQWQADQASEEIYTAIASLVIRDPSEVLPEVEEKEKLKESIQAAAAEVLAWETKGNDYGDIEGAMISFLVRYYANAIRSAESLQEVASLLAEAKAELSAIKTKVQTEGTGEAPAISLQTATIAGIPNQPCTGKAITPKVTVRAAGKTLISGVDFTATYSNNKEIGKATVRITAKSNAFSGSKTASFKIVPARTSITTITRKTGGKVNVAWKKVSASQKITRYQLRFRISGTTNWSYRSLSPTASSRGLAKLKKGTIYQFQVRSWKTINRVQYFSDWSPTAVSQKIR